MLKQRNKLSVYRSKLRENVDKPSHTADRREVSASNGTGRSSTCNSVWMVKTDSEDAFMPESLIIAKAKTDKSPHNPQGNLFRKRKRDLQRL